MKIEQSTGETPPALLAKPLLTEWDTDYWQAFQILSPSRQRGMSGPGAIPLSEIESYFRIYGIDDLEERNQFVLMIRGMDSVWLGHEAKRAERESKAKPKARK